jgi:putative oxidoreductase
MAAGLLLLRLVLGLSLAAHGAQKLFGVFGGGGVRGTAGGFEKMRFRAPALMALFAGLSEFGGGVFFAAGLLTTLAALALAVVMTIAAITVHFKSGFWAGKGGYEYNLLIWAGAVAVAATGPGRFSLDRAFGWDGTFCGARWGAGVAIGGVLIALLTLALGRKRQPAAP